MKMCNIDRIIKDPVLISRLDGYYQDINLDEYREEAEEIYRAGGSGGEEAEALRNLLYHLINRLELLEEDPRCKKVYYD